MRRHLGRGWAGYAPEQGPPPRASVHDPHLRAFVDTSVLLAAVGAADPDRRRLARGVLGAGAYLELVLSAQVLSEFAQTLRRSVPRPHREVRPGVVQELVVALAGSARIVAVTAADVVGALEIAESGIDVTLTSGEELHHRDALVVRTAIAARCDVLLTTALPDGTRFRGLDGSGGPEAVPGSGGLVVEDPFG
jgi:predicted nucleic acid-binding protein